MLCNVIHFLKRNHKVNQRCGTRIASGQYFLHCDQSRFIFLYLGSGAFHVVVVVVVVPRDTRQTDNTLIGGYFSIPKLNDSLVHSVAAAAAAVSLSVTGQLSEKGSPLRL